MHLQWNDRTSGTVEEDDLILKPDEVEFCTTGIVFLLKFKGSDKKMFFWIQEPKSDKDEEFCKKVNDFLNNPPSPRRDLRTYVGQLLRQEETRLKKVKEEEEPS